LACARSLFTFVRRTRRKQPCSMCTPVGLYLSPWLRDFDFLCFTVRLRRRNAAAACNIVKPQESTWDAARRGAARRRAAPGSIHRVGTERGKLCDRSILLVLVVIVVLRPTRRDIHMCFPFVQRPASSLTSQQKDLLLFYLANYS